MEEMRFTYFEAQCEDVFGAADQSPQTCGLCGRTGRCCELQAADYIVRPDGTPVAPERMPSVGLLSRAFARLTGRPAPVPSPPWHGQFGCYQCLREGRFGFCHDTEAGIVAPRAPIAGAEHWKRSVPDSFAQDAIDELLKTPPFPAWQPIRWLVHCDDFMVYIGSWETDDFHRNAPNGDGRALFLEMTDGVDPADAEHIWSEGGSDSYAGYYAFRCRRCGQLRGYFDFD